jgi:hypothetical protein
MNPHCKYRRAESARIDRWRESSALRAAIYMMLLVGLLVISTGKLLAASAVIRPGDPWFDTHGQRIQAHGGGITVWKGTYYWFGEDRSQSNDPDKRYVACYSSRDLVRWKFRGQVFRTAPIVQTIIWRSLYQAACCRSSLARRICCRRSSSRACRLCRPAI